MNRLFLCLLFTIKASAPLFSFEFDNFRIQRWLLCGKEFSVYEPDLRANDETSSVQAERLRFRSTEASSMNSDYDLLDKKMRIQFKSIETTNMNLNLTLLD